MRARHLRRFANTLFSVMTDRGVLTIKRRFWTVVRRLRHTPDVLFDHVVIGMVRTFATVALVGPFVAAGPPTSVTSPIHSAPFQLTGDGMFRGLFCQAPAVKSQEGAQIAAAKSDIPSARR